MPYYSSKDAGFTLVELVTVIVLLAIVSAFAIPRFFDADFYQKKGFSDELISALRYAQKYAVAAGCDVRVDINTEGYVVATHASKGECGRVPASGGNVLRLPSGEKMSSDAAPEALNEASVVFDALGRGREEDYTKLSSPKTISVLGKTITIYGESGYVDVQ